MALSFAERVALAKKKEAASPEAAVPTTTTTTAPKRTFALPKPTFPEEPTTSTPIVEEPPKKDEGPLPRVIQLANEANKLQDKVKESDGELLSKEMPDSVYVLKDKIARIQDTEGVDLRREMDDLRTLLKANPEACMYFLPEDTGLIVRALRKITDNKIAVDLGAAKTTKKAKATEAKPLSAAEMQAAWDDL